MDPSSVTQPLTTYGNGDRISRLPDHILHLILSFLRTRDVVMMSKLSKRWRNIWASMPYLEFDDESFEEGSMNFERFVDSVLLIRDKSDLHTLHLRWNSFYGIKRSHLYTWILYAVRHNIKELSFYVEMNGEEVDLPGCIFACETLERLSMLFCINASVRITSPMFVGFCRLKSLRLNCISHNNLLEKIISGCPILEDLSLLECSLENLDISSPTLKSLSIAECHIGGTMIRISIPSLISLCFIDNALEKLEILLENLSSLVDASIQTDDYPGVIWGDPNFTKPLKFVTSSVKSFSKEEPSDLPAFHSLKGLMLGGCHMSNNFQAIAHFLKHSPTLEVLTLENQALNNYERELWRPAKLSINCPHIKLWIRVNCGDENETVVELLEEVFASKCKCPIE